MGVNYPLSSSLEQELVSKTGELESQRKARETQMTDITLARIAEQVVSQKAAILTMMAKSKNLQAGLCEIAVREIMRAADGLLWCPNYTAKAGSDQRVMAFTGSHWEPVEAQQWKDFVKKCAWRIGVQNSQLMNPSFMNVLYETTAFNVAQYRTQQVPEDEVWLNLRNGTLVLKKDGIASLHDHSKEDVFTYTIPYDFDAQATCPLWLSFLERVLPEEKSRMVLGEFLGYTLMTSHRHEKMLWFYGQGQNGKSVTLEIIEALLGSDNYSTLNLSDLSNDDVKRAGFEGKLMNISSENGKDVNPSILKQLCSGERVLIKHLYSDPRETKNYGKLLASFNTLPLAENTVGYMRRLIIMPYNVTITKEELDKHLVEKLKCELSGILNWVLEGALRLMKNDCFTESPTCEEALQRYRLNSDSVCLFLSEMCEKSEILMKGNQIYTEYKSFCLESSLKAYGKQNFFTRLEALGYERHIQGKLPHFFIKVSSSL